MGWKWKGGFLVTGSSLEGLSLLLLTFSCPFLIKRNLDQLVPGVTDQVGRVEGSRLQCQRNQVVMVVRRVEKSGWNAHRGHGHVRAACGLDEVGSLSVVSTGQSRGILFFFPVLGCTNRQGHLSEEAQNIMEVKTKP